VNLGLAIEMMANVCTLEKVPKEGKLILLPSELTESHHPDAEQHTFTMRPA
jgi:hypothetical protein